jgi:hypothetical protein
MRCYPQNSRHLASLTAYPLTKTFGKTLIWSSKRGVTLDELAAAVSGHVGRPKEVQEFRQRLHGALSTHPEGGVERRRLVAAGLTADDCTAAIKAEWSMKSKINPLRPGMMPQHRRDVAQLVRGAEQLGGYVVDASGNCAWRAAAGASSSSGVVRWIHSAKSKPTCLSASPLGFWAESGP